MADEVLKPQQSKPNFLLRALIAFFFFIVIPILPSIAPDFLNLNLLSQSWELLHIVFVGIAVSYGLFSRRYSDSGADSPPKSDSPHSYVSRLLQASSVFDDDVDSPTSDDGGSHSNSKIQTWSSQYFRNDPMVVVANEKQIGSVISDADHKPLLLPVRSLKSRVSDDSRVYARSNSEPPNWSSSSNSNSELESVVLPSPIPWKSRSGRLEKKKKEDDDEQVVHHLPPMEPKRSEDLPIKKAIYRPPPPPPPPMPLFSKSSSAVKSCRTVRSRSWKEADEEEEEELNGNDFLGEVHATSDDDEEVDEVKGSVEEMENGREEGVGSCSTDVDKKADEFIAKFREQIRLQRIESIKRSTVQFSRSNGE